MNIPRSGFRAARNPVPAVLSAVALVAAVVATPAAAQNCDLCIATILPQKALNVAADGVSPGRDRLELAASEGRKPLKEAYLNFPLAGVPAGARVSNWILRLYLDQPLMYFTGGSRAPTGDPRQLVSVFPIPTVDSLKWAERPLGDRAAALGEVTKDTPRVDLGHECESAKDPGALALKVWCDQFTEVISSHLSLRVSSQSSQLDYRYYSMTDKDDMCGLGTSTLPCFNTQPRLIVSYSTGIIQPGSRWSQARHDAQRTGRSVWRIHEDPAAGDATHRQFAVRKVFTPEGIIQGDPVIFGGRLYFHTQLKDEEKHYLSAVRHDGQLLRSWKIKLPAKFTPAVDNLGRLYVATENSLFILNLEDLAQEPVEKPWKDLLHTEEATVRATPVIGYNGTVYLSAKTGVYKSERWVYETGVYALTPYPELKVLWKYSSHNISNNCFGAVALSNNEATAYVVDGTEGKLLAIDTTDGQEQWRAEISRNTNRVCDAETRAPVVGKTGEVYLTDGYPTGKSIYVFANAGMRRALFEDAKGFSQPLIGRERNVFVVKGDKSLCRLTNRFWARFACTEPGELNVDSALVADNGDRIYALDPTGTDNTQRVRGYRWTGIPGKPFVRLFGVDVKKTTSAADKESNNFNRNIVLAPDGTLYVVNDNHLFAIAQTQTPVKSLTLGKDDLKSATTYVAQNLVIAEGAEVKSTDDLILRAFDGVSVQPGVTIKKGARVVFRVGK